MPRKRATSPSTESKSALESLSNLPFIPAREITSDSSPASTGDYSPSSSTDIPSTSSFTDNGASFSSSTKKQQLARDVRGRPCLDMCHKSFATSVLSHRNRNMNLRGLLNLLFLIVVAQNARLVIENFMKYGVLIKPFPPSSVEDLVQNWPILLSLILMHGCFFMAFVIEKHIIPIIVGKFKHGYTISSAMICLANAILLLIIPYATIRVHVAEPVSASGLLALSITWALKLWSFHHVMTDVRYSLARGESFDGILGGEKASKYPSSLRFNEFYTFLVMPTLCFQFEYPRNPRIRWLSILRHSIELAICVILMKMIIEQYIVIIVRNTFLSMETLMEMTIPQIFGHLSERILKLSIPNLYVWLLTFVALFHHWLNILAEITRFGDREFYKDWWNANGFEEYWRKWNLPIHNFFNRHVNKPMLRAKIPKVIAGQIIFVISALAHEYMVCVPLHLGWTGLVFTAFMAQVPLMCLTSLNFFRANPTLGNFIFWIAFCFSGQPLAILVYYYLWGVKHGSVHELNVQKIAGM